MELNTAYIIVVRFQIQQCIFWKWKLGFLIFFSSYKNKIYPTQAGLPMFTYVYTGLHIKCTEVTASLTKTSTQALRGVNEYKATSQIF